MSTTRPVAGQYRGQGMGDRLARLSTLARDLGAAPNQLVVAWLTRSTPRAIPLVAGSTGEQVREDLGAASVVLTEEQVLWLCDGGERPS